MLAAQGKGGGGSAALMGTSVDVCGGDGAGRGGGSGACFALLASGSGHQRIGLPCALAAQGRGEGGTAALAGGSPGVAALSLIGPNKIRFNLQLEVQ
jgi:hypothetical protein